MRKSACRIKTTSPARRNTLVAQAKVYDAFFSHSATPLWPEHAPWCSAFV
jgi:hypothetical protein